MRLLAVAVLALSSLAALAGCSGASEDDVGASSDAITEGGEVVAIGDSITYGWDPTRLGDPKTFEPADYAGYAESIGRRQGRAVKNFSCPGEASASFLRDGEADNGCDAIRREYGLHQSRGRHATQAEALGDYLKRAVDAKRPPSLVTMTIGGNDLFLLDRSCTGPLAGACKAARLPIYAHRYEQNLKAIFDMIDRTGYEGTVVVSNLYAPDYGNVVEKLALKVLNDQVGDAMRKTAKDHPRLRLVVADTFSAYEKAADAVDGKTCATGLLIKNTDGTCDVHPSPKGQELIASTVLAAIEAQ